MIHTLHTTLLRNFLKPLGLFLSVTAVLAVSAIATAEEAVPAGVEVVMSTYLGGEGDEDAVVAAAIQSDGSVVLAAQVAPGTRIGEHTIPPPAGGGGGLAGVLIRLSGDGSRVLAVQDVAGVHDLAIDGGDNIYVATSGGVGKVSPDFSRVTPLHRTDAAVKRIDVAPDGTAVVLIPGKSNRIVILSPQGTVLGETTEGNFAEDVCIDPASQTAVVMGFRNARAFDGKRNYPIQICFMRGYGYDGERKWSDYGWSTDRDSDDFVNRPTNNMADTRGYRCSIGADGKLYAAFEAAGGNHIFRYSPHDISKESSAMVGGDQYHQFHNSKSEHKTVFGRFDPATGDAEQLIQFTARLGDGRANALRVKDGSIAADAEGRVYLGGASAFGLPVSWMPEGTGDYAGGAYLLIESPDLDDRELVTRLVAGGSTQTIAVREIDGVRHVVLGGQTGKPEAPLYTVAPLQEQPRGVDGFVAILRIR